MSDPIRIALVAEGPTDRVVIEAALQSALGGRQFILNQLQPETSVAFGPHGGGWSGVYRWCKQAAARGNGQLSADRLLFSGYELLIVHLDADVADKQYSSASIQPEPADPRLPCAEPCPPPNATTDALRKVLLGWCGEGSTPRRVVLCTPSKTMDAWVLAALFPADPVLRQDPECYPDPGSRLGQQPLPRRIKKNTLEYAKHAAEIEAAWSRLTGSSGLGEAIRFQDEIRAEAAAV